MSESEVDATLAVQGQSWDLSSEYPAADSAAVEDDLSALAGLIADIETRNRALTPLLGGLGSCRSSRAPTPFWRRARYTT